MRPVFQDRVNQRREDRTGSDLHEHSRTVAMHRLDHLGESHGPGEVIAQPRRDRAGVGGMGGRVEVGIDRPGRGLLDQLACQGRQWLASRGDQRRVKCGRDRRAAGPIAPGPRPGRALP